MTYFVDALKEIRFHVLSPRKTLLFHFVAGVLLALGL